MTVMILLPGVFWVWWLRREDSDASLTAEDAEVNTGKYYENDL